MLLYLYNKTLEKYFFQKKYDKYKSSIYFNSKSIQAIVYDKTKERESKGKEIEDFEEDVIRLEVRLQNKHLNYKKRSKDKLEKTLENYFKQEFFDDYMSKKLEKFLFKGDYYKPYHYKKRINNSKLKDKDKKALIQFLVDVSRNGLQKTKENSTRYFFEKRLKQLEELNINPIPIPKNWKVELKDGRIENPFFL